MRFLVVSLVTLVALWGCVPASTTSATNHADSSVINEAPSLKTSETTSNPAPSTLGSQQDASNSVNPVQKHADEGKVSIKDPPKNLFRWAFTKEDGLAQAQKIGGYAVLKFEAEWCGPCKVMKAEAFQDKSVANMLQRAVVVPLDVDTPAGGKVSEAFRADTLPTLVFVKPDGTEFGRLIGYMNVDWLKREVTKILDKSSYKN
ncbi:MAG: thioredoxin family protein [Chthonomonadaceae bacterium]|nr:thioredoxin family protein [Chthonomonadaceae bacterium]